MRERCLEWHDEPMHVLDCLRAGHKTCVVIFQRYLRNCCPLVLYAYLSSRGFSGTVGKGRKKQHYPITRGQNTFFPTGATFGEKKCPRQSIYGAIWRFTRAIYNIITSSYPTPLHITHYQTLLPTSQHSSTKDQKEIMFQQFTSIKNPGQK